MAEVPSVNVLPFLIPYSDLNYYLENAPSNHSAVSVALYFFYVPIYLQPEKQELSKLRGFYMKKKLIDRI